MRKSLLVMLAALPLAAPAWGQSTINGFCSGLPQGDYQQSCFTVGQAVESAQPQLGILVASGNPTLGTASTGGMHLGVLPKVSASARVNLVFIHLPDLLVANSSASGLNRSVGIPAPALGGNVSVGIFPGLSLAPTVGGIGSIDVLGSFTWLPFNAFGVKGFQEQKEKPAWGFGARVGLLKESFTMPGASVSVMWQRLNRAGFGNICRGEAVADATLGANGYRCLETTSTEPADAGEFAFDLNDLSVRAAVGKRLLGMGLTAGLGWDRYNSELGLGVRGPQAPAGVGTPFYRVQGVTVKNDRWSAFADLSYTLLVGTLALEGGWQQGDQPITGFPAGSDFDPKSGDLLRQRGSAAGLLRRSAVVEQDSGFMRLALELAERGWGRVAPNPLVGAVLVRDGEVVGEGWHTEFGAPHAEVEALRAAGAASPRAPPPT